MFTIIVPFYNSVATLPSALQSLLSQLNQDFEAILVNDGSSDDSLLLASEMIKGDGRFSIISSSRMGVAHARNLALEKARGDYIVFLDSDDWVPETFFSTLRELTRDFSPDILVFLYRAVQADKELYDKLPRSISRILSAKNVLHFENGFPNNMLRAVNPAVWNKAFRRSFISNNKLRFDNTYTHAEDIEYTFRSLIRAKCVTLSNEVLYNYRTGIAGTLSSQRYQSALASIKAVQSLLRTNGLEAGWKKALQDQLGEFTLQALVRRPRFSTLSELSSLLNQKENAAPEVPINLASALGKALFGRVKDHVGAL